MFIICDMNTFTEVISSALIGCASRNATSRRRSQDQHFFLVPLFRSAGQATAYRPVRVEVGERLARDLGKERRGEANPNCHENQQICTQVKRFVMGAFEGPRVCPTCFV